MDIPREKLLLMYERMLKIRHFENRVKDLFAAGELPGFVHLYLGEEAIAVGVCANLNDDDYITSTHRGHGHIIAKGGEMRCMMAELFAKSTGYNKGKGGSMHIAWPKLGILGANGIVSAGIPIATGAAMSAKVRKSGQIVACFFGDGASNEGTFHESLNIAGAFNL
ncbi:MAG TPA: thiamine pyrophosphate-dependent dehydrogenase E1 component subunit alpha, partial [Anaerolineaceae bacterium]|nr:thiamine pyrophosphate-dependent dehydrogenase E1 component subunit alpha [Anaerolineaceae bacterium]